MLGTEPTVFKIKRIKMINQHYFNLLVLSINSWECKVSLFLCTEQSKGDILNMYKGLKPLPFIPVFTGTL